MISVQLSVYGTIFILAFLAFLLFRQIKALLFLGILSLNLFLFTYFLYVPYEHSYMTCTAIRIINPLLFLFFTFSFYPDKDYKRSVYVFALPGVLLFLFLLFIPKTIHSAVLGAYMSIIILYLMYVILSERRFSLQHLLLFGTYVLMLSGILLKTLFPSALPRLVYEVNSLLRIILFSSTSVLYLSNYFRDKEKIYRETDTLKGLLLHQNTLLHKELAENEQFRQDLLVSMEDLREKEVFFERKMQHHVRNDLNIIIGIIHMHIEKQCFHAKTLDSLITRIDAISLAYSLLFEEGETKKISLDKYLRDMFDKIAEDHGLDNVTAVCNITDSLLSLNSAVHIGLLMNELMQNSFSHAFSIQAEKNVLEITAKIERDVLILSVKDNGKGTPLKNLKSRQSIGFAIIDMMIEQMNAEMELFNENGFLVVVRIPLVCLDIQRQRPDPDDGKKEPMTPERVVQ